MKIIRPGKAQDFTPTTPSTDESVPFVVAYDLLEETESRLNDEEAVAVGLALKALTTQTTNANKHSPWRLHAREEASNQTVLLLR